MYTNMEVVETLDLKNTARSRSRLQQNDNAVESKQDEDEGVDIIVTDAAPSISASATQRHPSISINPTKTFDEDAKHICEAFYGFLFPRIAPMRWTTFTILSISTAIPAALYILAFTKMGWGKDTFYYLANNWSSVPTPLALGLGVFAFILYLFDIQHWTSEGGIALRKFCYITLSLGMALFVLLISGSHPYGPITIFVISLPFYLGFIQYLFYNHKDSKDFIHWLSGPLFCVSLIVVTLWVVWSLIDIDNEWNLAIALSEAEESGCFPNYDDYPDCQVDGEVCFQFDEDTNKLDFGNCDDGEICQNIFEDCYNPFILWVGPFLVSLGLLFLSFLASFMRSNGTPEQETSKFAKLWMFLLFGVWVIASLSGAGAGVSTTLMALTLALFIASAIFINIAFNTAERQEKMEALTAHMTLKFAGYWDIFRGLLVVTCTPVFLAYLFISFIMQRIRAFAFSCYSKPELTTQSLRNVTGEGWFTIEGRRIIRMFQAWDTTSVFTYAVYWGMAFMVMFVIVSQYTLVFLSWLIEKTSEMNLVVVTFILVGVGMTMFLLPPVPGVPIYLTLGIVIIPVGRETFGIPIAIAYAMGVSLALKLLACTLQQKMIGGLLQNSVAIRQFVGINSNIIRAMKLVLQQPGMGIAKVSILVGGPDWPTSVLCGIMDLSLLPVLFGTLPIVFLILPTLLTGSFMYMADSTDGLGNNEFPWAGTMATVFTAVTAFVQFGSMVVAAYYLEKVMEEMKDELDSIPIDEEVRLADEKDEEHKKAYAEVSKWEDLPGPAQLILSLSLSCMIISCYLVQLFASNCFTDYQLTYTIDTHLDGDWRNLIKPLGVVANLLFVASVVFLICFTTWANHKARQKCMSQGAITPENGETDYGLHNGQDAEEQGGQSKVETK